MESSGLISFFFYVVTTAKKLPPEWPLCGVLGAFLLSVSASLPKISASGLEGRAGVFYFSLNLCALCGHQVTDPL